MGKRTNWFLALAFLSGILAVGSRAQEKTSTAASEDLSSYDVKREVSLVGTVVAFNPAAATAPRGAHLTLQTGSGVVDVHVGDPRLLTGNHFTIQSGDRLRIIGEDLAYGSGTQFVARVLQKGTQVMEVRSIRGIPLSFVGPRGADPAKTQGGAL